MTAAEYLAGEFSNADLDALADAGQRLLGQPAPFSSDAENDADIFSSDMKTTDSENLKDEVKTNEQCEPALTHKRADLEALADEVEHAAKRGDFERAEQKRRELKKALDQHERGRTQWFEWHRNPEKQTDEIESLAAHWLELVREFINAARDQRKRALVRKGERLINRINELAHDCYDLQQELQQSA